MCLSPRVLPNPNRNILSRSTDFAPFYDTESEHLLIPCGRCSVCLQLKQQYLVQRVQMESLDNIILYGMLSYNPETLPVMDVNGFKIKYADIRHFQDMIRLIRKNDNLPDFRYFACTERGGKRHRPHFHFMVFYPKSAVSDDYGRINSWHLQHLQAVFHPFFLERWRHNIGSRKFPIWKPNCTYIQRGFKRNYDLQVIDTISSDCADSAFYITKYSTKFDDYEDRLKSAIRLNTPEAEFKEIWQKIRSKYLMSKGFGNWRSPLVKEHIRKGIDYSLNNKDCFYPVFFSPYSGAQFPLCKYYRQKFITADEDLVFRQRLLAASPTGIISDAQIAEPLAPDVIERKMDAFARVQEQIRVRDVDLSQAFDFLSLEDYNNDDLILTDKSYGINQKLVAEDFESSDDW